MHRNKPEPLRDTARRPRSVCRAIRAACDAHPDQRVAQVIVNATGRRDPFYVEDNELIEALWGYAKGIAP